MAISTRWLARGTAVSPAVCRQRRDRLGQAGVALGEPSGVVAGERDVHAARVAEVDVGVVVGGLGGFGDRAHEGGALGERRRLEPGLDRLEDDPPVGQVVGRGELGARDRRGHAVHGRSGRDR